MKSEEIVVGALYRNRRNRAIYLGVQMAITNKMGQDVTLPTSYNKYLLIVKGHDLYRLVIPEENAPDFWKDFYLANNSFNGFEID